ncbi:unnamed protein product [Bursaphelenchus xylophilus]|uniref:(pine wood nematode) hypothetical protein n=1 Tax=Bursaphelenchus xylophilus TaxID=6326 RepID=A0A1I7SEY6_BURXY|nr:unnamed protein product [Bursaphelenchus xylophilus]CAG9113698.1 unnamed protein product [Bursaphelenchus xylophilus]
MFMTTYPMCPPALYGYPTYQMYCDANVWPESAGQVVPRPVFYQPVVQFVDTRIPTVQDVVEQVDARTNAAKAPEVGPQASSSLQRMPAKKIRDMRKRLPVFARIHIRGILEKKAREQEQMEMQREAAQSIVHCRQFSRNGKCSFGSGCFFSHQLPN